jgi:phosphoribosylformylglycinamidine (FGAM) synthase PurS component
VTTVEVLVRLAAQDPWSFTVFDTLKRKERIDELVAVTRLKSWRLRLGTSDPKVALGLVERVLAETAILANPNRDLSSIRPDGDVGLPARLWKREVETHPAFVVRVKDAEDPAARSALAVLGGRLGIREIAALESASVWVLEVDASAARAQAIARDISSARSWRVGLLANPHFQSVEIQLPEEYAPTSEVACP